ncbi:peptide deformylase [Microbacterium sp. NPDC089190]|uniref:peptide deformylase n=1 Tax=Microbacterium sp. NPDC089190 TaxID=3155063 RepID=UPI00344BF0E0
MTVQRIEQSDPRIPNAILGKRLGQVGRVVDESLLAEAKIVADDLIDTMNSQPLCVGLAANQIGSDLSLAVVSFPSSDRPPLVLVNPRIVSLSGKRDKKRESCMSVWGMMGEVERRTKALVAYQDMNLAPHEENFEGFQSRIVQHEIDHLNGILFSDLVQAGALLETTLFEGYEP